MAWKVPDTTVRLNILERFFISRGESGGFTKGAPKTQPREAPAKQPPLPPVCLTDGTAWADDTED